MPNAPRIFSYVVSHDHGTAPHPGNGNCVLSHCKFSKVPGRKNLLESVALDDWIVGTGGSGSETAAADRIVYAMKVEEILSIKQLFTDPRFTRKSPGFWHGTRKDPAYGTCFAASFREFYYFGRKAPKIPKRFLSFTSPQRSDAQSLKANRGYKRDFTDDFVSEFLAWLKKQPRGKSGEPVSPRGLMRASKPGKGCISC